MAGKSLQPHVVAVLSRAAWLAILLGLIMQVLVLVARVAAGGSATARA